MVDRKKFPRPRERISKQKEFFLQKLTFDFCRRYQIRVLVRVRRSRGRVTAAVARRFLLARGDRGRCGSAGRTRAADDDAAGPRAVRVLHSLVPVALRSHAQRAHHRGRGRGRHDRDGQQAGHHGRDAKTLAGAGVHHRRA